jgi:hypothetical protein
MFDRFCRCVARVLTLNCLSISFRYGSLRSGVPVELLRSHCSYASEALTLLLFLPNVCGMFVSDVAGPGAGISWTLGIWFNSLGGY